MEGPAPCPSCCPSCANLISSQLASTSASPFALRNLFPVGVLFLQVLPDYVSDLCAHKHDEDGWHPFVPSTFLERVLGKEDDAICGGIHYLVRHQFVLATYRVVDTAHVAVRLYLIPYDLEHVQGKLKVRKSEIVAPGKKHMRDLVPRLTRDRRNWEGLGPFVMEPVVRCEANDLTLAEIYGSLAPPSPSASALPGCDIMSRLLNFNDDLEGLGMRSSLYRYQRRSVAMMLERELDTRDTLDPLYLELTSMTGSKFYFQPGTMEVLRERPMVASSRGGVLCEELGTGKTVMVMGLILATLRQLPEPEASVVESRPVLTPLAFRHFPGLPFSTERERTSNKPKSPAKVPSLVELLLHRSRTAPNANILNPHTPQGLVEYQRTSTLAEHFEGLPLSKAIHDNTPFYLQSRDEPTNHVRTSRKRSAIQPRVMYLSSATLIVVPANLLSQWDREIQKHCEYPLRVLLLRTGTPLPEIHALVNDYDIILTTYKRFTMENSCKDVPKLHNVKICTCPEHPDYRIPQCECKPPNNVSPFLRIRWKRLVIDEGHVSASLTNILVPFTKLLSVERRWIVTGTPTTNLLGLGLGRKGEELGGTNVDDQVDVEMEDATDSAMQVDDSSDAQEDQSEQEHRKSTRASSQSSDSNSIVLTSSSTSSLDVEPSNSGRHRHKRIWTKYDREDLVKLGNMITHFVAVPQFAADPKLVNSHITEPLLDTRGPRPGSIQVLRQVMEMIMIRHRIEDIEHDVVLPPVKHESVMLDLDPYAIKSYNTLQAVIAINAIDSQRTDQDYMFHPKNAIYLQLTVKIMSQIMFWSVDHDVPNLDQLLADAKRHIDVALQRNMPQEDIQLLHDAFRHIAIATGDRTWRTMQTHEDVPYRVCGMDHTVFDHWSRIDREERHGPDMDGYEQEMNTDHTDSTFPPTNFTGFMHPDRLLLLRECVISRPLAPIGDLLRDGLEVAKLDRFYKRKFEEEEKKKQRRKKGGAGSTKSLGSNSQNRDSNASLESSQAASLSDPDSNTVTKKRTRNSGPAMHIQDETHANFKVSAAAKKAGASETLREIQKELDDSLRRLRAEEEGLGESEEHHRSPSKARLQRPDFSRNRTSLMGEGVSRLVLSNPLAQTRIGSTASSKLNYIIDEVLKYSPTEKILIFSESELSLAHIAEALDVIQVKYLRFTTQISPRFREQLVLTFETSETFRVFLMELKHGARGLNLISASRVIFCEPVWQADVESQAIKRAHRIGQTRPIHVKTLAIRRTAEENMVARRNALKDSLDKLPKLIEEAGMRHFIANPKFIEETPKLLTTVDVPLFHVQAGPEDELIAGHQHNDMDAPHSLNSQKSPLETPTRILKRTNIADNEESQVDACSVNGYEPPKKKIRVVRFE